MLDVYQDLIDELLGTPTEIRGLVDAAGEASVPLAGKQLIAEIRDRDRAVLGRVQAITRQDTPFLRAMPSSGANVSDDVSALMSEMEQARGDLVSLLINLSLKDWSRVAIDESEGEVTLADEVERHVDFDETQRRLFGEAMRAG